MSFALTRVGYIHAIFGGACSRPLMGISISRFGPSFAIATVFPRRRCAIVMGMLVLRSELGGELRRYRRRIALARMRRGWRTS